MHLVRRRVEGILEGVQKRLKLLECRGETFCLLDESLGFAVKLGEGAVVGSQTLADGDAEGEDTDDTSPDGKGVGHVGM